MSKLFKFSVLSLVFLFLVLGFRFYAKAEGCPATDYDCQIASLQKEYDSRKDAHEKNVLDLASYKKQLAGISAKLVELTKKLKATEKEIGQRETDLATQEEILSDRLRDIYKKEREFTFLTLLFSSKSVTDFNQGLTLRRATAQQDWQLVNSISQKISSLKWPKKLS